MTSVSPGEKSNALSAWATPTVAFSTMATLEPGCSNQGANRIVGLGHIGIHGVSRLIATEPGLAHEMIVDGIENRCRHE